MSTTDTKSPKGKDVKTEQSQRVQQILASSKTKEKRPKNLEQKIRLVKTSVAEGYADEDIERFLKESNYDEQTVINNILDGIAPRPGDSWSVVHNKMTKEERDAKKATVVQPTKPRGRGGRGGANEGQRSRGEGEDKKGSRDSSRGRGKNQTQRGGRGGRGTATGKFTKENGVSDQSSSQPPTTSTPAAGAAPTRPSIVPSGIITSSPNHPAPTVAQIVAGTFPLPNSANPSAPSTSTASSTGPTSAGPSTVANVQVPAAVAPSSSLDVVSSQPTTQTQHTPDLPSQNEKSSSEQSAISQAVSALQTIQESTEESKNDLQSASSAAQKATQQSKAAQLPTQNNSNFQRAGYTKKAQWKPKSSKEGARTTVPATQPNAVQPIAHSHNYQPPRGPVVLPGDYPSDIDDKTLNFTFGNFHIEEDRSSLEETVQPQTQQLQVQQSQVQQSQQPQPQPQPQPQSSQPQSHPQQVQPQQTQQLQPQAQQIPQHSQHQHPQHQHSHQHSQQHHQHHHQQQHPQQQQQQQQQQQTHQHQTQSDLKHQNKPHQPHHALQQTIPMPNGVLEQDHHLRADQQPLHPMHHMAEDLSQLYYMSPGPVMPFPLSHFPHPYEAETNAYYDPAGYQQTSYRTDGTKYPQMGRSTSPISSSNYRDAKFAGQDGNTSATQGSQTQPTGPGSPQTTQPHTFAPIQPPFSTMYPYYMGQFPQFSPANSPQYPFRVPVFKSPPYANYGGISSPAYPPTGAGYPEELAGQKYEAYMPPYTYMQPDAFMKQQQQAQQQQQPQSQATNQPVSGNSGAAKSQYVTAGAANGDLSSGKNGQDYAKYSANTGRDNYGNPAGAPQYPMAYQRPYGQ